MPTILMLSLILLKPSGEPSGKIHDMALFLRADECAEVAAILNAHPAKPANVQAICRKTEVDRT